MLTYEKPIMDILYIEANVVTASGDLTIGDGDGEQLNPYQFGTE